LRLKHTKRKIFGRRMRKKQFTTKSTLCLI